ncbi:MAG: SusD/RagB family nutrient-binding outer membrane lipoprotein [Bacteroidetes bacterium]|nr:SusD/RagB family nutrient-binding outer membrane lipoprotein [Bacteroidota bacterium]
MNKIFLTLLVSLVLLGSSCSDFLTVNEVNPNSASQVPAKLLLPSALNNIAYTMNNPRRFEFVYLWHGLWSISTGYTQPTPLTQYNLQNTSYQTAFNEMYTYGQNLTEIERASSDPKESNYLAIAMILKAYIMQNLVDVWGDVPYSEAFSTETGILKPKYDKQKDIYEDLVKKLDAAIKLIQTAPIGSTEIPANSDIMYAGDMSKWAKFANTLKLRMLVHQSGMTGRDTYIKAAVATTASVGYLGAGESGLVNPGFLNSPGKMNPFYGTYYKADGTQQSDGVSYHMGGMDVINFMKDTNDPRLGHFFNATTANPTQFDGNYLGQDASVHPPLPPTKTSYLGYKSGSEGYMIGTFDKSAPLLTDFESLFIQAEAAERGFITASGKTLYNAAMTQSCIYNGLTSDDAATFLSSAKTMVNYDLAPNKINLILQQKWVSLDGIAPVEIWTDYRRSGIPSNIHFSEDPNKLNDTPPIRLLYPQREISVNNDNLVAVGPINAFTSKIFWQNR